MATTLTKNARTLVAASTSNSAGGVTRGVLDLRTAMGGTLTGKITNGATGPTAACEMRVLVAHTTGATPTAASAGSDWKTIWTAAGNTDNSGEEEFVVHIDPGVMHLEVEFTGNEGQAVTVESFLSEITNSVTA